MARLGAYQVPESTLALAIETAKHLAEHHGGSASRKVLANSLGMSDRGGAFAAKIASLRQWGLAHGRGMLRLTEAGQKAVMPRSGREETSARRELALSAPLISGMVRSGRPLSAEPGRLEALLEQLTGERRGAIRPHLPALSRIVAELEPLFAAEVTNGYAGREASPNSEGGKPASRRLELTVGDATISLPETAANLAAAIAVLEARREALLALEVTGAATNADN